MKTSIKDKKRFINFNNLCNLDFELLLLKMDFEDTSSQLSSDDFSTDMSTIDSSNSNEDVTKDLNIVDTNEAIKKETYTTLDMNHPLMVKYQRDLKERLLKLLQETDEQLLDLNRTFAAHEKENCHLAERGYELQKELKQQEEKLEMIQSKCKEHSKKKQNTFSMCEEAKTKFQSVDNDLKSEIKKDLEHQKTLEDIAFEVVQLTALKMETFTDTKSLERAVEKSVKDREQLEMHKLRQDLIISRLENDRFALEDKINFYKTQWGIKKEEASDLRKELNSANAEMETINKEKRQIVHEWRQSLAALEKQDLVLAEICKSVKNFEESTRTVNMDIVAFKKLVRKELERNEQLIIRQQFRESDIAILKKNLNDALELERDLAENISVLDKTVEITEQELKLLVDSKNVKEKELETIERELQKVYSHRKTLENQHMDLLHEKMTITKSSKYTEKLIKDARNSIHKNEEKGALKENEKEKLLLKLDNLQAYMNNLEKSLKELQEERRERAILLDKSEASVLKAKEKLDAKRGEIRELDAKLKEMITQAGGQELAPFERELANLRKEIIVAEQGKRNLEEEYLKCQQRLFSLNKQISVKSEENDFYHKKIAIMEGKKIQLEADITKEEKDLKEAMDRIQSISNDIALINNLLNERKELQENLLQNTELSKSDFIKILEVAELKYLQKQNELKVLRRKKRKNFRKLMQSQQHIVYWEGKVHLADETRKIMKSESHQNEFFNLKSEIRQLQVKEEQIKKEQEKLIQEMRRAVYRHTSLYIEADKQSTFGKRRKSPEYVKKRIKHAQKKIQEDKKVLKSCNQQLESLQKEESTINDEFSSIQNLVSELTNKLQMLDYDISDKEQEKRQAVLELSFKQKKSKLMQKVLDKSYVRAMRNERQRLDEIEKLKEGLRAIQIISQAAINEYPDLEKSFVKILDYIYISKHI